MQCSKIDSQFMERFEYFAFDEVINENGQELETNTRFIAILSVLIGCFGKEAYEEMLTKALDADVEPIIIKEIVYQSIAYLGYGRMKPFLDITNGVLEKRGIKLPLASMMSTTLENRLEKGVEAQVAIFGEQMKGAWKKNHINKWLAANCFGDYYTRNGLTLAQREMITFCFLLAQGGCESQLTSHIIGNINVGNDQDFLLAVVSQCVPYIGYPRSLNAISCINKVNE